MAPLRAWLTVCVMSTAAAAAAPALAQVAGECPPGDWFCDDESPEGAPPPPELAPEPPEQSEPDSGTAEPPPPGMLPPRMDVTTPPPERPSDRPQEEPERRRSQSPWSVNMRLQGVTLGTSDGDAAMGGVGASLRYALTPHVVLDLGFDSFGGTDYNGHDRSESCLSTSALVLLNPHSAIRTYVLAGLHVSSAQVEVFGDQQDWGYVGGHTGIGLDFPVHERVSLALDLLGFLRGRTDSRAGREPEFTDGYGNLSNTSGGGLIRGGVTLYW